MYSDNWTVMEGGEDLKSNLRALTVASIRKYGVNGAAVLKELAFHARGAEQNNRAANPSRYTHGGKQYLAYPVGVKKAGERADQNWTCLSDYCPWICSRTFQREVSKFKKAGLIESIACPDPKKRYVVYCGKVYRNSHWCTVPARVVIEVLNNSKGQVVNYLVSHAVDYGLPAAILWNKVCHIDNGQRGNWIAKGQRDEWISLAPTHLSSITGLTYAEVRNGLAKLVKLGMLERIKGSCRYRLAVPNPWAGKNRPPDDSKVTTGCNSKPLPPEMQKQDVNRVKEQQVLRKEISEQQALRSDVLAIAAIKNRNAAPAPASAAPPLNLDEVRVFLRA